MSGTVAPTLIGFSNWVYNEMGVPVTALPTTSNYIGWAFNAALEIVIPELQTVSPLMYMLAVYNLASDNLINWAQDVPGSTYFANLRTKFDINSVVPGVITSVGDNGTSTGLATPEWMKNLALAQLQNLKTPWGVAYLSIAQRAGMTWGVS